MRDLENGSVINGATERDISKTEAPKRRKKMRDLENGSVIIGATK